MQFKDHLDYLDEVTKIIQDGQFYELLNFTNFSLCSLCNLYGDLLGKIIQSDSKIIIKHVIDNVTSVNTYDTFYLVHYLVKMDNVKLFDYFIDKYHMNLEAHDNDNWKPINYACYYKKLKMVEYLINKRVDLESQTNNCWKPIHHACCYGNLKMVEYLVNKGVNLESQNNDDWQPIHFVCRYGSHKIIEYLVTRIFDFESANNDGWRPIHLVCRYGDYDSIKLILSKNICLDTRINLYNKVAADYGVIDLLLMNNKLTFGKQQKLLKIINKKLNS